MIITELLNIVKKIKPLYEKYGIDELPKASNTNLVRLPLYIQLRLQSH